MQSSECSTDYNSKVIETVDLIKSLHWKKQIKVFIARKKCNYVWWHILTRLIGVIILWYIQILNNYVVYLKLI